MSAIPQYEVYAVKYAERTTTKSASFVFRDAHDGPLPMDYMVWVLIGGGKRFIVDLGFDQRYASWRNRALLRTPAEIVSSSLTCTTITAVLWQISPTPRFICKRASWPLLPGVS
jgi:hypothetical protein